MTHNHVDKNPVRPITKSNHPNHTDREGSATLTGFGLSEDSISGTPTGCSEGSRTIETLQVPTVFNRSR